MRIAVVSEGSSDVGMIGDAGHRGAVRVLVERRLGNPQGVEFTGRRLPVLHGRGGLKKKVKLGIQASHMRKEDGVVIVVDNDCRPPAERRKALSGAKDEAQVPIPVALGLAVQMMEAWLVADENAVGAVIGDRKSVKKTRDPEKITDPKRVLNDMANRRLTGRELEKIAMCLDLDVVVSRCKKGFGRFDKELKSNLGRLCNAGT